MWKTEINYYKDTILDHFSTYIGKKKVKELRIVMGSKKDKTQVKKDTLNLPQTWKTALPNPSITK